MLAYCSIQICFEGVRSGRCIAPPPWIPEEPRQNVKNEALLFEHDGPAGPMGAGATRAPAISGADVARVMRPIWVVVRILYPLLY